MMSPASTFRAKSPLNPLAPLIVARARLIIVSLSTLDTMRISVFVSVLAAALTLIGCQAHKAQSAGPPPPVPVSVATATQEAVSTEIRAVGTVESLNVRCQFLQETDQRQIKLRSSTGMWRCRSV